jgi:hypothetical protein
LSKDPDFPKWRFLSVFRFLNQIIQECSIRELLRSLFSIAGWWRGGLFGADNVGKTFRKVGDGFFDCSIAIITLRGAFGRLFYVERCILNCRTTFGGFIPLELHNSRHTTKGGWDKIPSLVRIS